MCHSCRFAILAEKRSATAEIVSSGLAPIERGITEASLT